MSVSSEKKLLAVSFAFSIFLTVSAAAAPAERLVLVYTRNQVGKDSAGKAFYVHDNIPASVEAIKKLGAENHFTVDVSDNPADFNDANLIRYKVIVFDNTNNEIFDKEEQKEALQHFIRAGGGFVGIHSASGAMRQWPYFWSVLGGKFNRHAKLQKFTVVVRDSANPSTAHLPEKFEWTDEFYYVDHIQDGLHVLLAGDLAGLDDPAKEKYPGKQFGSQFPLAWCHQFDGGREWYTSLGHQKEHYSDPMFTKHLLGGILWAMGETKSAATETKPTPKSVQQDATSVNSSETPVRTRPGKPKPGTSPD
jgi:type 1 glutamine amidotransferase